jgi:hypothetical protein
MKKDQIMPADKTKMSPTSVPRVNSRKFKLVVTRKTPTMPNTIPNNFLLPNFSFRINKLSTATQTAVKLTSNEDFDAVVKAIPTYCSK